jgi:starch phosphorylase
MNGALTLGTLDGANVEIAEKVGMENTEIFGLRAEEVAQLKYENDYDVWDIYNNDPEIKRVVDSLMSDEFSDIDKDFATIYEEILNKNDEYLVLKDFWAYHAAQRDVERRYENRSEWATMCLKNIACSGYFSSDRTIEEYVRDIWHAEKLDV